MSYIPAGGKELAVTGVAGFIGLSATQSIMVAALVIVVGGTLLAASKLLPRFAVEPVFVKKTGKHRLRLTRNGKPVVFWRRMRK